MLTLYIINTCDTCRKARKALEESGIPFKTHDLRKDGLSASLLEHILERVPLLEAINKRSTTWRQLDERSNRIAHALIKLGEGGAT